MRLGKRISDLRRKAGITQERLAEKAGLSLKHLGQIERGKGNPTLSSLEQLAVSLGVSLPELFELEHEQMTRGELVKQIGVIAKGADEAELKMLYRLIRAATS